ncbi:MAG: bacterial transcriptional activator domain-containing protein, partial [Candidatus Rokubacteria bacterium]|nr:bacterial transcriptional activator domain-containing protein [Candidatus Rokubacteria bacterium]
LSAAEARYTGDFLEEDLYADWSASLREEARATYVSVARALAKLAAGAGDRDAEIRLRLRILERDPYDEDAHLGLVAALASSGRHGESRRSYATYVSKMEELGVEPAAFPTARAA